MVEMVADVRRAEGHEVNSSFVVAVNGQGPRRKLVGSRNHQGGHQDGVDPLKFRAIGIHRRVWGTGKKTRPIALMTSGEVESSRLQAVDAKERDR